jgi:deazaflavin-dependent oxidoreductase (nitroreductase family)
MPGTTVSTGHLPYVDPTAPRGLIYRAWAWLAGSRVAAWLSPRTAWRIDPILMRLTRGRIGSGLLLPTALLETRGARTGQLRRNGLIYFNDGDGVVVIASKLGLPSHPSWYHNVVANPNVTLGGRPFTAEVVTDQAERERLWALADRVFPPYAAYRRRAAASGRTIPIVRLSPR